MRRVARRVQRIRCLPAWLGTAAMVAAISVVVPWDAMAHQNHEHDRAPRTNFAGHPARHHLVTHTQPKRAAHRKAARHLPSSPAPSGITRDDPLAPPWVIRTVAPRATAAGLAPSLLLAVAWRESGFSTTAKPGNGSTAAGMFQFNEDAWLDAIRIYGPKHGLTGYSNLLKLEDGGTTAVSNRARHRVLDLRHDVRVSAAMAAETMVGERGELEDDLGRTS